jgi:hypothetical protein
MLYSTSVPHPYPYPYLYLRLHHFTLICYRYPYLYVFTLFSNRCNCYQLSVGKLFGRTIVFPQEGRGRENEIA